MISDERLQEIIEADCLCESCEPELAKLSLEMASEIITRRSLSDGELSEALIDEEAQLIMDALGVWSSDDNNAPHERIEAMRQRLERIGAKRWYDGGAI